jgi:hypothetical protein
MGTRKIEHPKKDTADYPWMEVKIKEDGEYVEQILLGRM